MTIVEKEFYRDVQSKKVLAASSRRKKNGSRSKKCTLPSDNLTNKQLRERNGDTIVYNLTKPMWWTDFKRLPKHAQEEYLSFLCNNFSVTATDVAKMFGVVASTVLKYIESQNLSIHFRRGQRMTRVQKEKWNRFLMPEPILEQDVSEVTVTEPEELVQESEMAGTANGEGEIPAVALKPCDMKMSEITIRFDGIIDVAGIANTLKVILGDKSNGCLLISYTRAGLNESEESV